MDFLNIVRLKDDNALHLVGKNTTFQSIAEL